MRSQAMAFLVKLAMLLALMSVTESAMTVNQAIENGASGDILCSCISAVTLREVTPAQTLKPSGVLTFSFSSSLDDPVVTCEFSSKTVADLLSPKKVDVWDYLKSGFSDAPQMACLGTGCAWKAEEKGISYRSKDGGFVLYILWADILPTIPA